MLDPHTNTAAEPIVARIETGRQLQVRLRADGTYDLSRHIPGGAEPISEGHESLREALLAAVETYEAAEETPNK